MPEKISRLLYLGFDKKKINTLIKINNKQGNDEIMLNTLIIKGRVITLNIVLTYTYA